MLDLGPAAREVTGLLDGVTEAQLPGPTPCADTSVAKMLDHLMGLSLAFTQAARKTTGGAFHATPAQRRRTSTRTGAPSSRSGSVSWPSPGETRRRGRA